MWTLWIGTLWTDLDAVQGTGGRKRATGTGGPKRATCPLHSFLTHWIETLWIGTIWIGTLLM